MFYETSANSSMFNRAIEILINKPHVINRRLFDTVVIFRRKLAKKIDNTTMFNKIITFQSHAHDEDYLCVSKNICEAFDLLEFDPTNPNPLIEVYIHKLLPKSTKEQNEILISLVDTANCEVVFVSLKKSINLYPEFPFSISLTDKGIQLKILSEVLLESKSVQWLKNQVLPKVVKWAENLDEEQSTMCTTSHCLISIEKYHIKYNELKAKYGVEMVKTWPEKTDPAKFVYEDVAIASYLLTLWEDERLKTGKQNLQSFVDLGCGNGLLVYILTKEGHLGYGIDVRKRLIWDLYSKDVDLRVDTIVPSKDYLFPNTDWLIGNHSDELTPWIPIMAANSSYGCRFFLLPCCSYEFDGSRYQRNDSSKSLYRDYMEYISRICEVCGIHTQIDRLKIPSTKRICLVGQSRMYSFDQYNEKKIEIQVFIDARCNQNKSDEDNLELWASHFKPRESTEKVRNCTKLNKSTIEEVVKLVVKELLSHNRKKANNSWNAGTCLEIHSIAAVIPSERLKELKAECGGLQTLLRNNHNIFEVKQGKVNLRYPRTMSEVTQTKKGQKPIVIKAKPCWFNSNHPNGCPLASGVCSYIH